MVGEISGHCPGICGPSSPYLCLAILEPTFVSSIRSAASATATGSEIKVPLTWIDITGLLSSVGSDTRGERDLAVAADSLGVADRPVATNTQYSAHVSGVGPCQEGAQEVDS